MPTGVSIKRSNETQDANAFSLKKKIVFLPNHILKGNRLNKFTYLEYPPPPFF